MKNIFITGGAGYIGSHIVIALSKKGYKPIIIDNFTNSHKKIIRKIQLITKTKITFYNVDLRNKKKLLSIFKKHRCYSVIHCAGFKSVDESIEKPILYFENNIGSTLSLLECMRLNKIYKMIFSSSAAVYNKNQVLPLKETSNIGNTNNPYGTSKFVIEKILMDLAKSDYKWSIKIARYFNPISNHSSGLIKDDNSSSVNNLLSIITKVAQKKLPFVNVFGNNYKTKDGTGIRDYMHVMDLADAHVLLLKNYRFQKNLEIYNFGTGKGKTVLEVIKEFEKQTGASIPYNFSKKRRGDVPASFCSNKKAKKELDWKIKYDFVKSIKDINKIL